MSKIYNRKKTRIVRIGDRYIGGDNPILLQSMTNTNTSDIAKTVYQIHQLEEAGCDLIRIAILNMEDTEAVKCIKKQIHIPLIADIHYDFKLAILAIKNGVDKIRINPGNIAETNNLRKIVETAKEYEIPIRIGTNSGCIKTENSTLQKEREAKRLAENTLNYCRMFENMNYNNIVLAAKISDVEESIDAHRYLSMACDYPLHIGVTETGIEEIGIIKSSIALGALLSEGIGDTIRVSLTGDPIDEVIVGKEILANFGMKKRGIEIISCPTCGRCRTNVIEVVNELKKHINKYNKEIKVAVMGCSVNGPGEAKNADMGIAGGINEYLLFKKGEIICKIPKEQAVERLLYEIEKF